MDSQVSYPLGNEYENALPSVGLNQEINGGGNEEQEQGKKSVVKKVKAKAKKIKDTLAKHTINYDRSNGAGDQVSDEHNVDEEDDEDEEIAEEIQRPEIHGAPICKSTQVRNPAAGEIRSENGNGDEKRHDSTQPLTPEILSDWTKVSHSSYKYGPEEEEEEEDQLKVNFPAPEPMPVDLEEDPHAPTDPYKKPVQQFKVSDPSGQGSTEETGVTRLIRSFEKNVESYPEPELRQSYSPKHIQDFQSESHDNFLPEPALPTTTAGDDSIETHDYPTNQSSYTDKISEATSAITGRAMSAKNMVLSKLGYGGKDNETETREENSVSPGEDGNKFSSATSAIVDGAISAKNVVTSKLGYGEENSASPGENGNKLSAVIVDKAISAKNVVASKLGYGEKDPDRETHEENGVKEPSALPVEYGKKVAANVYEKVAGAGTTVVSMVKGTDAGGGENKGVSIKDYLSEKLKPGEEDKALSGIIASAVHKSKEDDDPSEVESPVWKVTESEEVRRRLGGEDEGCENGENLKKTGKGMVGKITDTVGSWMGKSGGELQLQASPRSIATSQGKGN